MINGDKNLARNEQKITKIQHNRPRPRHGPKYTIYKMCLSIIMVICIKQHLGNIWSWKKALLIKKSCIPPFIVLLSSQRVMQTPWKCSVGIYWEQRGLNGCVHQIFMFLFTQFLCLKPLLEQHHVPLPFFIQRKIWTSVKVNWFLLCFAWNFSNNKNSMSTKSENNSSLQYK